MYKVKPPKPTIIECNDSEIGEFIEEKVRRIYEDAELIDGAEEIFEGRGEGINPLHNPRTNVIEMLNEQSTGSVSKYREGRAQMRKIEGAQEPGATQEPGANV
jgi:hypothetical protein